jgi:hypothetical protein
MVTVRIEHAVRDFQTWKAAFDRDPADRRRSGVQRYEIRRPVDDSNYVAIDLDFASQTQAEAFLVTMRGVWASPQALHALGGAPQARIWNTETSEALPA